MPTFRMFSIFFLSSSSRKAYRTDPKK